MKKIVTVVLLAAVALTSCSEEEVKKRSKDAVCVELKNQYEQAVDGHKDILVRQLRREIRRECK